MLAGLRFRMLLLALMAAVLRPWLTHAVEAAAVDQPIALPPFIVEEPTKGRSWRYTEADGNEVLSRCSDPVTQKVVEAHHRLHQLLGEILPKTLQLKLTVPKALILYDEELQPAASQEVVARMMRPAATAPPIEHPVPFGGARGFRAPVVSPRYTFLPNLRLWDRDAMALFMIVPRDAYDSETLALTSNYVAYLLNNRVPALPAWFIRGFLDVYEQAKFEGRQLSIGPLEWISKSATTALKKDPKTASALLPLADFFSGRLPRPEGEEKIAAETIRLWRAQAALFVRWGLDGRGAPRRAGLWKFVERAAMQGETEKLFEECFGVGHAAALEQLTAYRAAAVRNSVRFRLPGGASTPVLALRDASGAQIARIKGDWERMEVPFVKAISSGLTGKYLEQARRTLMRAYDRDERDPRLLAVLGLLECDVGNEARALELLEIAAHIEPLRPRAAYELARLRFVRFRVAAAAAGGRLSSTQAAEVLTPLFAARRLDPPLPEVYELIGDVWAHGVAEPSRGHLLVLDEGVRLFPRRTALILRTASLYAQRGFRDEAAAFVALGLSVAADDTAREPFVRLQQQLEAAR
jgi:hypothetical protein